MSCLTRKLILFLSVVAIISCSGQTEEQNSGTVINNPTDGLWQDQSESPLQFTLEQTYGDNKEMILSQTYQIDGPVADQAGNIYFIDGQNGKLYSFDPNGHLRWEKGNKGKGPGDFEDPNGLVTDGEFLYTANVNGSRIDKFDLEGNLINTKTLEQLDLSFVQVEGFILDSLLVTSSTLWGKVGKKINILNTNDNLDPISSFDIIPQEIDFGKGMSFGMDIRIIDSLIAAGNVQNYAIHFYDNSGKQVKTVKRDFDKLVRPGFIQSGSSRAIRGFGSLSAPVAISSDYYIARLNWPTNVDDPDQYLKRSRSENSSVPDVIFKNAMDLYNDDGKLLYSDSQNGSIHEIGSIAYVDTKGNIYTKSNDPFPQIKRYSLTITSPYLDETSNEPVDLDTGE